MNIVYSVTIQGNVPQGSPNQGSWPPTVNPSPSYTSHREVVVVTTSIREAIAFASAGLKSTEVITNVYAAHQDAIVDPACVQRG